MGIHAALTDQPKLRQAPQQRTQDLGPLPDQHQHFRIPQPLGQDIVVLDMVVPDRDVMPVQHREARQRADGVEGVVKDRDFHRRLAASKASPRWVSSIRIGWPGRWVRSTNPASIASSHTVNRRATQGNQASAGRAHRTWEPPFHPVNTIRMEPPLPCCPMQIRAVIHTPMVSGYSRHQPHKRGNAPAAPSTGSAAGTGTAVTARATSSCSTGLPRRRSGPGPLAG